MAGGKNAAIVPCGKCVRAAVRTSEGLEDDYYRCSECGYEFGIDWSYDGPPQKPCWPISEEETEERRKIAGLVFGTEGTSKER
jgi:DNA-directed RNA polymerase subunit RPC12/RpoP